MQGRRNHEPGGEATGGAEPGFPLTEWVKSKVNEVARGAGPGAGVVSRGRGSMKRVVFVAVALSAAAAVAQSSSAVPAFDLDRVFSPDPAAPASSLHASGDGLRAGALRVSLLGHYQHRPLRLLVDGESVGAVIGSRVSSHLGVAWAASDRIELGLQLPVVWWQGGDDLRARGVEPVAATALGAPVMQARYSMLRQSQGSPIDLGFTLGASIPLGSEAALTRDPGLGFALMPRVGVGHAFGSLFRVGGEVGAVVRGQQLLTPFADEVRDEVGSLVTIAASATTLGDHLRGQLDVRAIAPLSRTTASVEVLGGVRYLIPQSRLELLLLGGPGFGSMPGTPAFRVLGGIAWTPLAPPVCRDDEPYRLADCASLDRDRDGIANGVDACPELPGVAALSGCADRDDDGDGLMNLVDACPARAGAGDGCPPADADADGIIDARDACPREAGASTAAGCPDGDADGVADAQDACPTQAGALAGCPDVDGDQIADGRDACPNDAAPGSSTGCASVSVSKSGLALGARVQFELNRDVIAPASFGLLDEVAQVLRSNPELGRVVIEGHTDDLGPAAFNRELSQRRAESVRRFLVEKGVDPARLEARGFGPDRPLTPNVDAASRERNRRVEFTTSK
jgi:outer membrane protein OmpA-like peptidoglycan-associated protein